MSEEEQNLSRRERRAQAKTAKSGNDGEDVKDRNQRLRAEAAAKRRRLREAERETAAEEGLDAGEKVDDAFVRSADAGARFLRDNFAWLQWIIIAGVAGAMGMLIYEYQQGLKREKQGAQLASVLSAEFGRLAEADPTTPSDSRLVDPRQEFSSEDELFKKSAGGWDSLKGSKQITLKLAGQLGRAGVLYDQGKFKEARAAYEKLLGDSKLSLHPQIKGRALEGVGFTYEAEEQYEDAKKHFEKLSSVDTTEFKNLKGFHVARMEFLLGNKDKAKELLTALDEKLSADAGPQGPTDYVGAAVRDLLKTVDPSRAAEEQAALQAEQMKQFMKQLEDMKKNGGAPNIPGLPAPGAPTPPAAPISLTGTTPETPAPSSPAPEAPKAPAPVAPAPKAPTPTAPAPVTPAPVTPAPVTPAPVAPAPAPVAPAPAPAPAPVAPAPAPAPETP